MLLGLVWCSFPLDLHASPLLGDVGYPACSRHLHDATPTFRLMQPCLGHSCFSLRHSQAQALPHANSSRLGGWASFFVALLSRGGANAAFRQQQHRRAASAATWVATGPWPHVAAEPVPDKLSRRKSWHLHSRPHLRVRCTYEAWIATRTWGSKDLWLGYGGLCILLTGSTPCRGPRPLRCVLAS